MTMPFTLARVSLSFYTLLAVTWGLQCMVGKGDSSQRQPCPQGSECCAEIFIQTIGGSSRLTKQCLPKTDTCHPNFCHTDSNQGGTVISKHCHCKGNACNQRFGFTVRDTKEPRRKIKDRNRLQVTPRDFMCHGNPTPCLTKCCYIARRRLRTLGVEEGLGPGVIEQGCSSETSCQPGKCFMGSNDLENLNICFCNNTSYCNKKFFHEPLSQLKGLPGGISPAGTGVIMDDVVPPPAESYKRSFPMVTPNNFRCYEHEENALRAIVNEYCPAPCCFYELIQDFGQKKGGFVSYVNRRSCGIDYRDCPEPGHQFCMKDVTGARVRNYCYCSWSECNQFPLIRYFISNYANQPSNHGSRLQTTMNWLILTLFTLCSIAAND